MNINILGISELKLKGMGKYNSDNHFIYYCGQEPFRRNGVVLIVNKRVRNAVLGCSLKNNRMILVCFKGKPFNFSFFGITAWDIDLDYYDVEWLCLGNKLISFYWF